MISDVPTPQDFYDAGHELFDFAWDTVARFWIALAEAEGWGVDKDEVSEEYWKAAKGRLASSLAVTQQGVELILKGKIAEISPFLLLSDPPSKWPAEPKSFADYRTTDAQDLVRLFNSISDSKLPESFIRRFNELRNSRNRIFHSVDKNLTMAASEVLETILAFNKTFFPNQSWPHERAELVSRSPDSKLDGSDWSRNFVCQEIEVVIKILESAAAKNYFGVDKKKHLYQCPECLDLMNSDDDRLYMMSQLQPPTAASKELFCPICNVKHSVVRQSCSDCGESVLSEEGRCLSCGQWSDQ